MKSYWAFQLWDGRERDVIEYEYKDAIPPDIVAGSLHIVDAESKADALAKCGVSITEIVARVFCDIDFLGYKLARKDWWY